MTIFLSIIHYVVCLVLIIVILLQAGKGQGLSGGGFGNETANSIFGTKTGDILTKITTISAIAFIVTSLSLDILNSRRQQSLMQGLEDLSFPSELADIAKDKNIDLNELKKHLETVKTDISESTQELKDVQTEIEDVTKQVTEAKEIANAVTSDATGVQ